MKLPVEQSLLKEKNRKLNFTLVLDIMVENTMSSLTDVFITNRLKSVNESVNELFDFFLTEIDEVYLFSFFFIFCFVLFC